MKAALLAVSLLLFALGTIPAAPSTFCNPLNLDYGWRAGSYRHGADPVIVLFKDRYYLFSTWDVAGFRVSDDLLKWNTRTFPTKVLPLTTSDNGTYCAPAVAACGDWLYFINMIPRKGQGFAPIMRSRDPLAADWEQCGQIRPVKDPAMFFDDDGRAWMYHGLSTPTRVFEIDARTWTEIRGSEVELRTAVTNTAEFVGGYERGRREIFAETDTGALLDNLKMLPCQEAAWMTKRNGRYYLQYSTPGTVSQWYCDVAMEGSSPTGPFKLADYSPVSLKVGGFIGSAGHSGVFQDRKGQWWRVTTLWIGVHDLFERRLGLFPVHFDAQGALSTDTVLGDYPRRISDGALTGWMVQSYRAHCKASSSLENHPPELASDENVRTWWSAQTGGTNEWLQMDLGKSSRVCAVQVNFAEQDARFASSENYVAYRLLASNDGATWQTLVDRSANRSSAPHDYIQLEKPISARHLRLENVHTACGGRLAVSDLRVFGDGGGLAPAAVAGVSVERHANDGRNVTIRWRRNTQAQGYLVRFGSTPEALYHCIQVQGGGTERLTMHALARGLKYAWRVDSYNENGVTPGVPVREP